jgi:hypothetical protein
MTVSASLTIMLIGANIALMNMHTGVMSMKVILLAILIQQRIVIILSVSIAMKTIALGVMTVKPVITMGAILTMKVLVG